MGRRADHVDHVSAETLEAVAAGERPVTEVALDALEHLGGEVAAVCAACRETLRAYPPGRIAERAGGTYTERHARRAAKAEDLVAEHRAAVELLEELAGEANLARAVAKVMSPRFATFGFCGVLMDEAAALIPEQPEHGWKLALLAVVVAERVDRHRYRDWPSLPDDLVCASRGMLADGLRAKGELEEAEGELRLAEAARERGSGGRYYRMELDLVRCRLLLVQGRAREARELAHGVEEWAMRPGTDREDFLWEAIRMGAEASRALDQPARAAEELQVVAAAMRGKASWRKEQRVRLDLVAALVEADMPREAWAELGKVRMLSDASESAVALARESLWEGIVYGKLGRTEGAARSLETARDVLVREGLGLEALRASLQLLAVLGEGEREEEFEGWVDRLPELLTVEGLPGWGAAHLLWVLEGIASAEGRKRGTTAALGAAVLDALSLKGDWRKDGETVQ